MVCSRPDGRSLLLIAAVSGGMVATANAAVTFDAAYTLHGDSANDEFGGSGSAAGTNSRDGNGSIANVGDLDGDGINDLIVGAPGGRYARVFSGADGTELYTLAPNHHRFGTAVGSVDLDGDGVNELLVGARQSDLNATNTGYLRVYSGSDGTELTDRQIVGEGAQDELGSGAAGIGDVDGDGFDDYIVGAWQTDTGTNGRTGRAYVISGQTGSTLRTHDGDLDGHDFGLNVTALGDVTGDTVADYAVGAPRWDLGGGASSLGRVTIFDGADGTVVREHDGLSQNDMLGESLALAGDVDGDGIPDIIAGTRFGGYAVVFSGSDGSTIHIVSGDDEDDFFGTSVAGIGDVDGDGFDDFLVGAEFAFDEQDDDTGGYARIFSGFDGSTMLTLYGDEAGDRFGTSVASLGDINGDGIFDLAIGAHAGGENGGGYVRVFTSVPEPASVMLVGLGAVLLTPRRRR